MTTREISDLVEEARHARERYELYRAKVYGPSPTTLTRLRELEQISRLAERRLHTVQARQKLAADGLVPFKANRDAG